MAQELSRDDVLIRLDEFIVEVNGNPEVEVDIGGGQRTVEPRPVYDFERSILDDVISSTVSGGASGAAIPVKGRWIHGWLKENTDEYINGLWVNYQFFLKYLEAETMKVENISAYNKSPGTYDSMYRYLLVLEDIGLIDRYRREEVQESEYDFNVPEEFRTRTFIRLKASYEDNKQLWNNPIGAEYGDVEAQDVEQFEGFGDKTPEEIREDRDDEEDESERSTFDDLIDVDDEVEDVDKLIDTGEQTDDDDAEEEEVDKDDEIEEQDQDVITDEGANITDLEDPTVIPKYLEEIENDVITESLDQDPLNREFNESAVSFQRLAVLGKWANGTATPGEDQLFLFTSIKTEENLGEVNKPTFLQNAVARNIQNRLEDEDPFGDIFGSYKVKTVYNSNYKSEIKRIIKTSSLGQQYFDYTNAEYIEVDS